MGRRHGSEVSRYERGVRVPLLADILAFEIIYRVSARELFVGTFDDTARDVRDRARKLSRHLDAQPFTPLIKRKMSSLVDVINKHSGQRAA